MTVRGWEDSKRTGMSVEDTWVHARQSVFQHDDLTTTKSLLLFFFNVVDRINNNDLLLKFA